MANKKITLDNLAGMIKRGFDDVDKRFDHVETRLSHVEARLNGVENNLIEIKENIVSSHQHEDLKVRVEVIEEKIGIIS